MLDRRKIQSCFAAAAASLALGFVGTESAAAYTHAWGCNYYGENIRCFDNTGAQFNPWRSLQFSTDGSAVSQTCVKGNLNGSAGSPNPRNPQFCAGGNGVSGSWSSGSPSTWAYGYFVGGGTHVIRGYADTP